MVHNFKPDYLIVGIEVNLLIQNNPACWNSYVQLHQHVYTELKTVYPDLPVGLSVFCVPYFPEWSPQSNLTAQMEGLKDIEPWTDFISFSAHPFMSELLAENFPDDYFQRLFELTKKPVSISERSYPAQSWQTINSPIIDFNGTEEKQGGFLSVFDILLPPTQL